MYSRRHRSPGYEPHALWAEEEEHRRLSSMERASAAWHVDPKSRLWNQHGGCAAQAPAGGGGWEGDEEEEERAALRELLSSLSPAGRAAIGAEGAPREDQGNRQHLVSYAREEVLYHQAMAQEGQWTEPRSTAASHVALAPLASSSDARALGHASKLRAGLRWDEFRLRPEEARLYAHFRLCALTFRGIQHSLLSTNLYSV